jgi:hypothetical protein
MNSQPVSRAIGLYPVSMPTRSALLPRRPARSTGPGRRRSDRRSSPIGRGGVLVPVGGPLADVALEGRPARIRTAVDFLRGELGDAPLDHGQPGGRRRPEVQVEARVAKPPTHDVGVLWWRRCPGSGARRDRRGRSRRWGRGTSLPPTASASATASGAAMSPDRHCKEEDNREAVLKVRRDEGRGRASPTQGERTPGRLGRELPVRYDGTSDQGNPPPFIDERSGARRPTEGGRPRSAGRGLVGIGNVRAKSCDATRGIPTRFEPSAASLRGC